MNVLKELVRLLLPTAGLLIAVVIAAGLQERVTRASLRTGAATVAVALLAGLFGIQLWKAALDVKHQRIPAPKGYGAASEDAARFNCVQASGASRTAFFPWLRQRIPPGARYYIAGGGKVPVPDIECTSFNLLPAIQVTKPGEAEWIVFYGAIAPDLRARVTGPLIQYAPSYSLGRVA